MSSNRSIRITRRTAARLLDGANPDDASGLARVLAAAGAPSSSDELAGEQAALAMFHAAQLTPAPAPGRTSVLKATLAKLLAAKFLAIGAAAVAGGGIALAATTGTLPNLLGHQHSTASHSQSSVGSAHSQRNAAHSGQPSDAALADLATAGPNATDSASDSASTSPKPGPSPSPSLVGLCRAYEAGASNDQGKALQNPAFTALLTAAGADAAAVDPATIDPATVDPATVQAFCSTLGVQLSSHPNARPSSHPNGAAPSHPTGRPSSLPAGAPATHPSGPPSSHPSGPPSTLPNGR